MLTRCLIVTSILTLTVALRAAEPASTNDYSAVEAIFNKHCLDCHAAQDPEGKLVLESFETLMKGGENGPVIVPSKSAESRLVRMIEGQLENKDGKKLIMPPGKRKKLEAAEIANIKAWIDGGAKPPAEGEPGLVQLVVPKITPKVPPRRAIKALAYAAGPKLIAAARYGEVELRSADNHAVVRTLSGHRGSVNALVFSSDGKELFAAAGEPGLFGEVRQWNVADGTLVRTFEGHRDALYSVALSPDGKILATGSYDQKIKLWNAASGEELKTLSGHNGAIFDLAFRPDGKILASASGDRTVKLWDVATGARRDTLAQSLKELYSLAFSPDGQRLVAGGVDNRIRVWQISEKADETTNPILYSKFAHEGTILKIVFSSDGKTLLSSAEDRTVKLWDAAEVTERFVLEAQSDWAPALAFASENKTVVVGRLDGTLGFYDAGTAKPLPPAKPEVARIEPRGIQRGVTARIKLIGSNLTALNEVKFANSKVKGELVRDLKADEKEAWINVTSPPDLARDSYEFSVTNPDGESGKVKLHVDDLPQIYESDSTNRVATLPVSFWGTINKTGDVDQFNFEASGGQTIVFDLAGKNIGSKINGVLTLADSKGIVLAADSGFDGGDPLLAFRLPATGRYTVRINDLLLAASEDHFFRVSVGQFPYVTGFYPLSVAAKTKSEIELIGYNLPLPAKIAVSAEKSGDMDLPLKPDEYRMRRALKVLVSDTIELAESEPNDLANHATHITAPCAVSGRIWTMSGGPSSDVDIYQFDAKAGQTWIIETQAAQRGSPIDTKIEVLHQDGRPVERLLLQAVRDSHVTFRGIDSTSTDCRVENWEEMELNQYLYLQGEVVKLFRAPQGPDSGFLF
ncbi:MAG: c-type cytochrome domain-containing protein, partial [Verrucomicrobiota bacterium]